MDHERAGLLSHLEVAEILKSDPTKGLTSAEAQERLCLHGLNRLNSNGSQMNSFGSSGDDYSEIMLDDEGCFEAGVSKLIRRSSRKVLELLTRYFNQNVLQFLKQFLNPLIQLLIICMIVSALLGEFENCTSIGLAILIVSLLSYFQERRADKSLEKLSKQMPSSCKVVRDGIMQEINVEHLVPGDIVHLSEGQRIPADCRLYDIHSFTVDESNLTGETQSLVKTSEAIKQPFALSSSSSVFESRQLTLSRFPTSDKQHYETITTTRDDSGSNNLARNHYSNTYETFRAQQVDGEFLYQNLALMGTLVECGHSRGIVIATGRLTRYGQVYQMLKTTQQPHSPLQTNIDQLSIQLVVFACCIIAAVSIIGITQQRRILEIAYYAISLAVTAIPEGLPVVLSVITAMGVIRLSQRRTIIKSMTSIETLGCVQILCADKTGTLTKSNMTLTDIVTSELHSLSSSELEQLNQEECLKQMTFNKLGGKMYSIGRLMECGTLCNNATVEHSSEHNEYYQQIGDDSTGDYGENTKGAPRGHRRHKGSITYKLHGQATECAILDASLRLGYGDSRDKFERLSEIPFSSSSRRMIVRCQRRDLGSASDNGPTMFYVKGAWEEILKDCTYYYESGMPKAKTDEMWLEYSRICSTLGSQGLRVLALASGQTLDQLSFVGLIGINNSLRDGIVETVQDLRQKYHVDFKMITGDSKATAMAVGRSLGLLSKLGEKEKSNEHRGSKVYTIEDYHHERFMMSGDQLQRLLNTDIDQAQKGRELLGKTIFYRVDPIQKANIISKLQDLGRIVAMTGDGVNDVISLKRANLSLVMGSGADVCREIADVILLDDQMEVLRDAVLEGKGIYHKIQSFLAYQISISLTLFVMIGVAFGYRTEAPFTVNQLLLINILADGPQAQSLAMERLGEHELVMWPRNAKESLVTCRLMGQLLSLSSLLIALNLTLYEYLLDLSQQSGAVDGRLDAHCRSLMFSFFVFCTVYIALSLRSKWKTVLETRIYSNLELLLCCSVVLVLQIGLIQLSGGDDGQTWIGETFDTESVEWMEMLYVFLYASIVLIVMDCIKAAIRLLMYFKILACKATRKNDTNEPELTYLTTRDST